MENLPENLRAYSSTWEHLELKPCLVSLPLFPVCYTAWLRISGFVWLVFIIDKYVLYRCVATWDLIEIQNPLYLCLTYIFQSFGYSYGFPLNLVLALNLY